MILSTRTLFRSPAMTAFPDRPYSKIWIWDFLRKSSNQALNF